MGDLSFREKLLSGATSLTGRFDLMAKHFPDRIAQIYVEDGRAESTPHILSFEWLVTEARRRANALRAAGLNPDDVVAVMTPNGPLAYPTLFGAFVAGTTLCLNYFLETDALVRLISSAGAKVLLTAARYADEPGCLTKIAQIKQALPALKHLVYGDNGESGAGVSLERIAQQVSSNQWPNNDDRSDRIVALLSTGGTTGLPKLVPHTEQMYLHLIDATGAAQGTSLGDVMMGGLPLFHTSGAVHCALVCALRGATVVVPSSKGFRDPLFVENYWKFVERYRATVGAGVPTVVAALSAGRGDADVSSMRHFLVGGAPLSVSTVEAFERTTGGVKVCEGWGMTETCGFATMNPPGRDKIGSAGLPIAGVELGVRPWSGKQGVQCQANEIGEVVVRGAAVMRGYLQAEHNQNAFTADGWLRTGDLGRLDEDGFLWITGRIKDLIIRGGHNIDPGVIEDIAYRHAAVQLAAAVGRPDKYSGELPILFVKFKPQLEVSAAEILEFVSANIPERAATPKEVIIVPEMPLSGPGKILKPALRREAIRAQFQKELDVVLTKLGALAAVAIVDDERSGTVAEIRLFGSPDDRLQAEKSVAQALSGYTIGYRLVS